MGTGGVLDEGANPTGPFMTQAEFDTVTAVAKDYNFTVAAHCHGQEGIMRAIRAGVNSVEHATFMDEEAMQLAKEKGVFYVPTLTAGYFTTQYAKEGK
mmetsp:Transcript_46401/g.101315  ORF Transcript_46401/g.101315 Transcript_46401/m.101315 type:complete len:98 (-) Transcript_46401:373-666(-)|eukprot:CAMPEP_0116928038 /NCGR_PEP_ID=MMETSP0467-20121206/25736_1 /TAXON_ID=283647 /ORGANISM="Mesodinium pulex, Strain SPMC105" /LENGTH=97 /DNA_ID=CAMNT_0004607717 /DNA_START=575 /DNA_END=868 /DNA_ORIENTATION=+